MVADFLYSDWYLAVHGMGNHCIFGSNYRCEFGALRSSENGWRREMETVTACDASLHPQHDCDIAHYESWQDDAGIL